MLLCMNQDVIDDLRQFITATVSQQLADVATKDDIAELRNELKGDISSLDKKIVRLDKKVDNLPKLARR